MVPAYVAGQQGLQDCAISLEALAQRSGVRWLRGSVVALDAHHKSIQLDDGSHLEFDWLSLDMGTVQDRDFIETTIPGSREHALFMQPVDAFISLWPRVSKMGDARALRIALIGGSAADVEVALAIRHRLPNAAVTLVCSQTALDANYSAKLQRRIQAVLRTQRITMLQDTVTSMSAEALHLGCGADLACDIALLTVGAKPPQWLKDSGLALDKDGYLALDRHLRSISHSRIFAALDISHQVDCTGPASAIDALRAGRTLAHNLRAAVDGSRLKAYSPSSMPLTLLAYGKHSAIGCWGSLTAQGRWVRWLKDWADRRLLARLGQPDVLR